MRNCHSHRLCIILLIVMSLAGLAHAQVVITGNVSDGLGGPLLSGTVYHATGSITVPTGLTLTIQPGAIVKFTSTFTLTVSGTLNVTASGLNRAILTRIEDDTAGGDTNGDGGATVPSPGTWRGLFFSTSSGNGTVNGLDLRYTGSAGTAAVRTAGSGPVILNDCIIRDFTNGALDCTNTGLPIVSNCVIRDGDVPGKNIPIEAIPGFTNNTACANSTHNSWPINSASIDASISIDATNQMSGGFVLTSSMTVSTGISLTLGAGVVFKVSLTSVSITINGTLVCNGTVGSKVGFTTFDDDSLGGDTNADGPSVGSPSSWRGITFAGTGAGSLLTQTVVSFAGNLSRAGVSIVGSDPIFTNCSITDCSADGVDLNNLTNSALFTDCNFDRNGRSVDRALLQELDNFSNCTASDNTTSDIVKTTNNIISANTTIDTNNIIAGAIQVDSSITINVGTTLTLEAGIICKLSQTSLSVTAAGNLIANGTAGNPVVFTTIDDDSFGGDSNKDGPSVGSPGSHRGMKFQSTSTGTVLTYLISRFAGNLSRSAIETTNVDIVMTNCTIEDGAAIGLSLLGSSAPNVTDCTFDRCSIPIRTASIEAIPGFSNNSASGNSTYDAIENTDTSMSADVTIDEINLLGKVLVNTGSTTIMAGVTLTLNEGVVIKHVVTSSSFSVSGSLQCLGTDFRPVVFTILQDDGFGGDTNEDGAATLPTPASWRGISFLSGSGPHFMNHTRLRFAGNLSLPGIALSVGDVTMTNSVVEECGAAAISFNTGDFSPIIRNCSFDNCGRSMDNMRLVNFKNLRDNTASGNSLSNSPRVTSATVGPDDVILKRSLIDNVVIQSASITVSVADSLRIESGCIFKFTGTSSSLGVTGGITQILGAGLEPVIFTSIADDEFGGDTNLDGPSTGSPGQWRGVNLGSTPTALGQVHHVIVRYSGNLSLPGFTCNSNNFAISSVRVEHCGAQGIVLGGAFGDVDNFVAFDCTNGIDLNAGSFNLRHATVTGCSGVGIDLAAPYLGLIQNSISFGNGTNFNGTTALNLFGSDGDAALAGVNGNIDADPMFVDPSPAIGDLTLDAASPCVGTADFFVSLFVGSDYFDSTRVADRDLDGVALSDMGAHEAAPFVLVFAGEPVSGNTMFFAMLGPIGIGFLYLGLDDGLPFYFHPYGLYLAGDANMPFFELPVDANFGYPITFPLEPTLVGTRFSVQMVGAVAGNLGVGSFTSAYRGIIQD